MATKVKAVSTLQFMETFSKFDIRKKMQTIDKLKKNIKNQPPEYVPTLKAIVAWCEINLFVGDDLCPPTMEHLTTFLSKPN